MTFLNAHHAGVSSRHYVVNPRSGWFNLFQSRIDEFRERHGDDFCIVLNRSDDKDHLYVIPCAMAKRALRAELLDHRRRWVGSVRGHKVRINRNRVWLPLGPFYNAFGLLEWFPD